MIGVILFVIFEVLLLLMFYFIVRKDINKIERKWALKTMPNKEKPIVIGDLLDKAIDEQIDYILITKNGKTLIQSPFDLETLLILSVNYRDIEFKDYEWEYDTDDCAKWLLIHI